MSRSVAKRSILPADTLSWGGTNPAGRIEFPVLNILKEAFRSVLGRNSEKHWIGLLPEVSLGFVI